VIEPSRSWWAPSVFLSLTRFVSTFGDFAKTNTLIVGFLVAVILTFIVWKCRRGSKRDSVIRRLFRMQSPQDRAAQNDRHMTESLLGNAGVMETSRGTNNVPPPPYLDLHNTESSPRSTSPVVTRPASLLHRPISRCMPSGGILISRTKSAATSGARQPTDSLATPQPIAVANQRETPMSSTENDNTGPPLWLVPGTTASMLLPSETASIATDQRRSVRSSASSTIGWTAGGRHTNHSGWSEWFRYDNTAPQSEQGPRSSVGSVGSVGGVSIASSGVLTPAFSNWSMLPATPTTTQACGKKDKSDGSEKV
jgi:hypothetical protein